MDATMVSGLGDGNMEIMEMESNVTKKYLDWCRAHRFVKCIEHPVPDGILPKNYKGILIDIKVQGEKKFSGPDDKLYAAHEDLRMNVARGNSVLELQHRDGPRVISTTYIFMVFALRKFSGGMGDEDEDNSCQNMWQKYFLKPIESASKVIVTEKANGEAAHLSCRLIGGQTLFCLGSKNVHMLVRNQDDIKHYTDSRFLVARVVAEAFFRNYVDNPDIDSATKEKLYSFMQESRSTGIFELLQPKCQHIVDLSYLDHPELRFICWSENYATEANHAKGDTSTCDSLCLVPPNHAIDEARGFKLATIEYEIIDASEAENYMAKIRSERDYEGKVLYFADSSDKVFGLIKKKTAWYIILRAIREKACSFVCGKNSFTKHEMQTKVTKRIVEIQRWLEFSDEFLKHWTDMGKAFTIWVVNLIRGQPKNHHGVRSEFPQLWKKFLDTNENYKTMYEELTYS